MDERIKRRSEAIAKARRIGLTYSDIARSVGMSAANLSTILSRETVNSRFACLLDKWLDDNILSVPDKSSRTDEEMTIIEAAQFLRELANVISNIRYPSAVRISLLEVNLQSLLRLLSSLQQP